MSQFKRATLVGGAPNRNALAKLRDVQIVEHKPKLPAEIMSTVLQYLPAPDLIRCARVSRRMCEMVYDDSRWVQKLKLMGCWDETKARAKINEGSEASSQDGSLRSPTKHADGTQVNDKRRSSSASNDLLGGSSPEMRETSKPPDGFDQVPLSPNSRASNPESAALLGILKSVRSVRGRARSEYGRVHKALRPFYKDAIRTKHPTNAKIFRYFRDPNQQALMISQVVRFADSDTSPGKELRDERLHAMVSAFENAVILEYEQGLKIADVDGRMKKYAAVLVTLNGGKRAVAEFISQNPLFQNKTKFGDPLDCFSPSSSELFFLEEAVSFFRYLTNSANEQLDIVSRIFPTSVNVAEPLLLKIAEQIISPYLTVLFDTAHTKSTESYLRAVSGTYEQMTVLQNNLNPPGSQQSFDKTFLQVVTDLYLTHFQTYLDSEQAYFKRRTDTEVDGWERQMTQQDASIESLYMANVNRQADKRDFMSSFRKVVMMPVNALPAFPFGAKPATPKPESTGEKLETPSSQIPRRSQTPVQPGGVPPRTPSPFIDPPTTELAAKAAIMKTRLEGIKSLFSLEVALSLVHMAKASLERTAAFAKTPSQFQSTARNQCETIFITLLKTLGNRHVRIGFDKAVDHLSKYRPLATSDREEGQPHGVAPLATFLELVNVGDLIQQMLDVFFEQELVATKLCDRNDFLSPVLKEKKRFEQMLDERVAAGLNKGIEVLMAEVDYICATTQSMEDYNPAPGSASVDIGPSRTATLVVDVVDAHVKMLVGSTDKVMLDVFNQEVGLRLYQTLCKHIKRQRISVDGSITLISDINHYYNFITTLKNKDLLQYYRALRELSQIYLIDPNNAKEMAAIVADTDRYLGIIRPEEVYEFAERRADWYQVRQRVEKAMYGVECNVM